jgi:hypothetical protein
MTRTNREVYEFFRGFSHWSSGAGQYICFSRLGHRVSGAMAGTHLARMPWQALAYAHGYAIPLL